MPFLAQEKAYIPTKDILSWSFDEPKYDLSKPVYIDAADPNRNITGNQAKSLIRKIAAGLRNNGIKKGDCVCVASFNDILYPIVVLGIIASGGVFTGTNPGYTPFELAHHVKTSKAKLVIAEPELLPSVMEASKDLHIEQEHVFVFNPIGQKVPEGFKSWEDLLQHGEEDWTRFDGLGKASTTDAMLLFSSGTTGLPKAARLSHYNLIGQHTLVLEHKPRDSEIRRLIAMPMFHAAMAPVAHTTPLRNGQATYIMRRFDLEGYLQNIEKYQITDMPMVPPIAVAIIMSPLSRKYSLKSVVVATCGAAPLDKAAQARLRELLSKEATFTQVWGMTETSCVATLFYYPDEDATGSVGRFAANLDAKLVDDNGKDITAYDVRGELCVRGPTVVRGYIENSEANKRDWDEEGFFHTGDIAYRDGKSKLWYIVDRKKELIKVRGFQVAPPELEGVLLSHPGIMDAAVIGISTTTASSSELTELPRAYIVRKPTPEGKALTERDVKAYFGKRLAKYKQLDGGIVFVDMIPKTASGKILKRLLRERAKKEVGARL